MNDARRWRTTHGEQELSRLATETETEIKTGTDRHTRGNQTCAGIDCSSSPADRHRDKDGDGPPLPQRRRRRRRRTTTATLWRNQTCADGDRRTAKDTAHIDYPRPIESLINRREGLSIKGLHGDGLMNE